MFFFFLDVVWKRWNILKVWKQCDVAKCVVKISERWKGTLLLAGSLVSPLTCVPCPLIHSLGSSFLPNSEDLACAQFLEPSIAAAIAVWIFRFEMSYLAILAGNSCRYGKSVDSSLGCLLPWSILVSLIDLIREFWFYSNIWSSAVAAVLTTTWKFSGVGTDRLGSSHALATESATEKRNRGKQNCVYTSYPDKPENTVKAGSLRPN